MIQLGTIGLDHVWSIKCKDARLCVDLILSLAITDIVSSQHYLTSSGKDTKTLMTSQMHKLAELQEFERANEIKKRIKFRSFASRAVLQQFFDKY